MILAPLAEEYGAVSGPAPIDAAGLATSAPRPAFLETPGLFDADGPAVRFAREGLSPAAASGFETGIRTREATLAESGTARLSLAVGQSRAPGSVFADLRPDYVEAGGMRLAGLRRTPARDMAVRYESFLNATSPDGLDVGIAPRAGVKLSEAGRAYEAGATLRVGRYIREELEGRPAWWLFAGADRQAVRYNPVERLDLRDALAHGDQAMVGDAQAGIAARIAGADISFAYVMRETTYSIPSQSWSTEEGFAAFSLSLTR